MPVLKTEEDDGTARLTISIADDDHRFEIWQDGDVARVEYQETLTWRGRVEVSEPDEDIFKELMVSDEVTEYLDKYDLEGVQRAT